MVSSLEIVLIKIFARGFYRVNAGFFLFLFVTLATYCFFIEVLNQTHLEQEQRIINNLIIVMTLLRSPQMAMLVFLVWSIVAVKSWIYTSEQIFDPANRFLFYSVNSQSVSRQWVGWLVVQLVISIPMLIYGGFCLIVGIAYGHYIVPVIIFIFVILLSSIGSYLFVRKTNHLITSDYKTRLLRFSIHWPKPFFSLFLYHVFDKLIISFTVTKVFCFLIIYSSVYLLSGTDSAMAMSITTLGIIATHSILIYQSRQFEDSQLSFSMNFPVNGAMIYFSWMLSYALLTLPENIWLLTSSDKTTGIGLVVLNLSAGMAFRNLLYVQCREMKTFLQWIFYSMTVFFLLVLLKMVWLLIPSLLLISIWLFRRDFYRRESLWSV